MMIPLYKPYMPLLPELNNILTSGKLSYGAYGLEFEKKLSEFLGTNYVLIISNYNLTVLVTLSVLNIGFGDEIITSPMACLASTQPLATIGAKVIWADIDPRTGTLCPDSVEKKITTKTKAIIHNHYCGYLGYIDEINSIGQKYGIPIIDDGIEAFGSEFKGKKLGNCGTDVTIFSFNPIRIPNTIDGGAIAFKDKDLYEKCKLVRDSGIDRRKFRDGLGEISPNCDISIKGYSAMMSDVNSYIGLQQMSHIDHLISKQRQNAEFWDKKLIKYDGVEKITTDGCKPNYWVYGILTLDKEKAIRQFRDEGYYASSVHINNDIYSLFDNQTHFKGVNEFYSKFVALPSGWWMETKND